ncbi:hypothetical protein V8J88_21635 [Massilia sp. W12]|uniref:hypothetical protein n=1 Tax=Massilia sp. W12 TaxID=3126507 RepID=UPI0030CCF96B
MTHSNPQLPAAAELPEPAPAEMAEMLSLLQESQQSWNAARIAEREAQAEAELAAPEMDEMMALLQESQQTWNAARVAEREAQAEAELAAPEMDEMMALLQESQQTWNAARVAEREEEAAAELAAPEMDEMMALLQESQQTWNAKRVAERDAGLPPAPLASTVQLDTDLLALARNGGEAAIALWQYCVRAVNPDALFILLLEEYRLRPTHEALLALFDCFCAPQAQARISAAAHISQNSLFLQQISQLREEWRIWQDFQQLRRQHPEQELTPPRRSQPYRSVFDGLQKQLLEQESSGWRLACRSYDPAQSPNRNLPGGDMTPQQRLFVSRIWQPLLRPRLVAAGFWKLATVE